MLVCSVIIATIRGDRPNERQIQNKEQISRGGMDLHKCHGIETVTSHRFTKTEWGSEVDKMASRGASATDAEFDTIVEYLAKNFGKEELSDTTSRKEEKKLDVNTASASQLEQFLGIAAS